jgi:hypothetical protein
MTITQNDIDSRNGANARAMAVQHELRELFTPYLGRKLRKVSGYGGFVAAAQKDFERLQSELAAEGVHLWCSQSVSWLYAGLRCNGCPTVDVSIGKVQESTGELLELFEVHQRRTDYTLTEVQSKQAEAQQLERQARDLRSEIRDFERR